MSDGRCQRLEQKASANGRVRSQGLWAKGVGHHEPQKPSTKKPGRRNSESQTVMANPFGQRAVSAMTVAKPQTSKKHIFCMYHLQSVCKYSSERCAYAHSVEEIQRARESSEFGGPSHETKVPIAGSFEPPGSSWVASPAAAGTVSPFGFNAPLPLWPGSAPASGRTANLFTNASSGRDGGHPTSITIGTPGIGATTPWLGQPPLSPSSGLDITSQPMYIDVPSLSTRQPDIGQVYADLSEIAHVGRSWEASFGDCGHGAFAEENMAQHEELLRILTARPDVAPCRGLVDQSGHFHAQVAQRC